MNKSIKMIFMVVFTVLFTDVGAQEKGYEAYRTSSWSLYTEGGATWGHGLGMKNVKAAPFTDIFPEFGLGVAYNIKPWVRVGLNYDWSGFRREQKLDQFSPEVANARSEDHELVERAEGLAYARMNMRYHALDLMAEFNIMEIWKERQSKRFNLYAGLGVGFMISKGCTYSISMGHERWLDGYSEKIHTWLKAKNTGDDRSSVYVPMALTAEYEISPLVTVGVQGSYKYLFKDAYLAPAGVATASIMLKVNLLGRRHGYTGTKTLLRQYKAENEALRKELGKLRSSQ